MSYLPYDEYVGRYIAEQRVRAGIREAEIRCSCVRQAPSGRDGYPAGRAGCWGIWVTYW
jgi:hypothetical protein